MEKRPNLQSSIDDLYQMFSSYPLPEYTNPCPCCHTIEDDARLRSVPLRGLSADDLNDYVNDALTTWGDLPEFKHFLPRIFEIYFSQSESNFEFLDPEILFSKFKHARWLTWPEHEQASIRGLLHALWHEVLRDPPPADSYTDIQCWICAIGQAEDDLEPYLSEWIEDHRISALFALSSFLLTDVGRNAFWEGREAQYAQLRAWRKSRAVALKLEGALALASTESDRNELIAALGAISCS